MGHNQKTLATILLQEFFQFDLIFREPLKIPPIYCKKEQNVIYLQEQKYIFYGAKQKL